MFDRLEQFDEGVIAGSCAVGRLIGLIVTNISMYESKRGTYSKQYRKANKYHFRRWE